MNKLQLPEEVNGAEALVAIFSDKKKFEERMKEIIKVTEELNEKLDMVKKMADADKYLAQAESTKLQAEHDMSLAKKEMIKADKFMSETKVYHQTIVDRETEFNKKSTEVLEGNEKEEKYLVNKRVLSFIRFISPFI